MMSWGKRRQACQASQPEPFEISLLLGRSRHVGCHPTVERYKTANGADLNDV